MIYLILLSINFKNFKKILLIFQFKKFIILVKAKKIFGIYLSLLFYYKITHIHRKYFFLFLIFFNSNINNKKNISIFIFPTYKK